MGPHQLYHSLSFDDFRFHWSGAFARLIAASGIFFITSRASIDDSRLPAIRLRRRLLARAGDDDFNAIKFYAMPKIVR